MKLSKAQQAVVDLMREGWSLCKSTTFDGTAWLQERGCGRGGKTRNVNLNTFSALLDRGIIKRKQNGFPTSCYELAEEWRAAE